MTLDWICHECGKEFPGEMRGWILKKSPRCPKCKSKKTYPVADFGRVGRKHS